MSRQVLSLLLVHANRMVSMESLMEELWGDSPPKLARKTVQTHIYHVRKALRDSARDGAWVETAQRGYRIRVDKGQLDLWRFEELCAAGKEALSGGQPEAASGAYREALALWRGPAFSGTATGVLLSAQRARLEDLRMGALERRIEADMALGRHRELLSELKGLAIDHPLNEVIAGQLMRVAARSGYRQVALDAYRRLRAAMVDQLGLEPSAKVKELQQGILEDALPPERQPAASAVEAARPTVPAELPPRNSDFTGRREELRAIVAATCPTAGDVGGSSVRIAVVSGGVGSGKTVTAVEAAHRLRAWFPGGQLFATLHRPDGTPVSARDALASLLMSSGHSGRRLPAAVEDLSRLFRSWTAERHMLVVLDDAHGPEQVLPLLPSSPDCAVLITSRWRLEGLPGAVTRIPLHGLSEDEGVALLGRISSAERIGREQRAAEELVRLYEGLPLAVRALGERLSARSDLLVSSLLGRARQDAQRLAVLQGPWNDLLARLVQAHLRLPEAERELLGLLSRLPRPVLEQELLQAMDGSGQCTGDFCRLVESLVAANFLERHMCRKGLAFSVPELSRRVFAERDQSPRRDPLRFVAPAAEAGDSREPAVLAGAHR
ncbi:AfsR/SARP family transcriptional regulator [Streptomyces sp. ET3-23]|uniref:AfsR/SARP family transcriptional regulator n=1 Tax=Streptomyces sp. ET3-23 TaxID=2885643 RepID=UPI001D11930C|nr:AfsR/SARP family transcriptional regulator [Streptomyces sp. ET3-23]MCC2280443.1 AfsR/SARP family transcriptional regulator [Streptomyces sp. ET3-23]